ncbi:PepSY-associated TM helix domain-containing protein [Oecophyllibacter saccharovorans]|uniref:PepSY-associated TM helix domain-containing protein n=1 Tax=Oecophyllibacter saccharovorans TaxID=2558360 RepID=UPI001167E16B|nr:PepSY-associated TM helix domain-containing protein [Oecophyllibacter saccharovorans]TPW36718.1 PepSY domain-containing protein [Oecophyllibacter saccharovorans]
MKNNSGNNAPKGTSGRKPAGLRGVLRFVHRWVGFPAGLVLTALFYSGLLSLFSADLQGWMQPATLTQAPLAPRALEEAEALVRHPHSKDSGLQASRHWKATPFLNLPQPGAPGLHLWQYDGHVFRGPALDPASGARLAGQDVAGGAFFVTLHDSFHLRAPWGSLLVTVAGGCFLVSLFTGLLLQWPRLKPAFLQFRPYGSAHRSWLDLHLLAGTLAFAVLLLTGVSGTFLAATDLLPEKVQPRLTNPPARLQDQSVLTPAPHTLPELVATGTALWGRGQNGFVLFSGLGATLYRSDGGQFCPMRSHVDTAGRVTTARRCSLYGFMRGLHDLRWAPSTIRWLYGFCGLAGLGVLASGLILFQKSEARKAAAAPARAPRRLVGLYQGAVIGALAGIPLATLGLLWASRLSSPLPDPVLWQEEVFFTLWGTSFLLPLLSWIFPGAPENMPRSQTLCWGSVLLPLSLLGLGLPVLDFITRHPSLFSTPDSAVLWGTDLAGVLTGLVGASVLLHLRRSCRPCPKAPGPLS